MRQTHRWLGAAAVLVVLAGTARADEEKVPLNKLPRAVVDAVKAKYPGAELKGAEKEVEKGKTYYEVALTHKGKKLEVTLTPEGKIVEVEKEITARDLPAPVTEGIEAKYPKAKIKRAEEITKGGKTLYEALIETADKKKFEVVLDPTGKIVKTEAKGEKKK